MNRDGSGRSKVSPFPIGQINDISSDRRWVSGLAAGPPGGTIAIPTTGGKPRVICRSCGNLAEWDSRGKFFYFNVDSLQKVWAIPTIAGEALPKLPPSGIGGLDLSSVFPGSRVIENFLISPGPDPSVYAYVKTTMRRNLFRIPLP